MPVDKENTGLRKAASGLFWRTFSILFLLVLTSIGAWLYGLSFLDEEPRARSLSQRISSITTLTRYALISADTSYRFDLIMALAVREGLVILPKEENDIVTPLPEGRFSDFLTDFVRSSLGQRTLLASRVNGYPGLWVSFEIDGDAYWLRAEREHSPPRLGANWIFWFGGMLLMVTLFTMVLTGRIIEPLDRLSIVARSLGRGRYPDPLPLEGPKEIQQVNESFNVMVADMKRLANDREVLLAGVSHDLRTPITRLRLEVELAPINDETREAMCSDLDQMEHIVKQFMNYVREGQQPLEVVDLSATVDGVIANMRLGLHDDTIFTADIDPNLEVRANPTELARAIQNVIVNAQKYGRSTDGKLRLAITLKHNKKRGLAELTFSDDGAGLPESELQRVLRPFERGQEARSNASGSGLGLSIVDRVAKAASGSVRLSQNIPNGLRVQVVMPLVPKISLVRAKATD